MKGMDDHSYHASATESPVELAEMLELDGEVLHAYLTSAIAWVSDLAAGHGPRRIVDLGSGTGAGTIALAQAFPTATVVALDSSGELLCRVEAKARDIGAVDRIIPVKADLDDAWPAMEAVDLAWASMSLHHLADPDRVLTDIFALLRGGGLIAVAEMDGLPRFLPDDLGIGQPGLERRCHDALAQAHARQMPSLGLDWGPRLSLAGFAFPSPGGPSGSTSTLPSPRPLAGTPRCSCATSGPNSSASSPPTTRPSSTPSSRTAARTASCTATTSPSVAPGPSGQVGNREAALATMRTADSLVAPRRRVAVPWGRMT